MGNYISLYYPFGSHQVVINKSLTIYTMIVKIMLKSAAIVENYCNICVAYYGYLTTNFINVKFNT